MHHFGFRPGWRGRLGGSASADMSSIYFDSVLAVQSPVKCVAWSRDEDKPLLAVADGTLVRVFRDEGDELADAVQTRSVSCTSLAWHPLAKVLAAGWEDGTLTLAGPTGITRDDREVHRDAAVICIVFNPAGTRCVSADSHGVVGVWKTDAKGMFSQMCHYRKHGAHDHVIFRTVGPLGEPEKNPPFFFGGEEGALYVADDFGLCAERYRVGSPIQILEYFHQRDMVVIVTKTALLAQFSLDAEGKVVNETKLKLSCGPQPEKLQGVWAGSGLFATVSHESIVRLWNLADDENYILSLQGAGDKSLAVDKATSIDFNPRKRVLTTGTRSGRLVQWRCSTVSTPKSEACWQVLPVVHASDLAIDRVAWGPGESVHARTEKSSIVLSEAQLNTAVQPPYLLVQTAPMQAILHNMEQGTRSVISSTFRVKGVSLGGSPALALLWNSKQVTVYDVDTTSVHSTFKQDGPITAAALLAHVERNVVLVIGDKVHFTNLAGHVQRTLSVAEGVLSLDVNGAFLVSSSRNVMRVWNVSRAQPKLVGTRKFEGSLEVRSVKINCAGTRVSVLVDHVSASIRAPDSRLFLYDIDSDSFVNFCCKNRVPVAHGWEQGDPRLLFCEVVPQALVDEDVLVTSSEAETVEPVHEVVTLLVSGTDYILQHDSMKCAESGGPPRMPVAFVVPYMYFAQQLGDVDACRDGASATISRTVLRDFAGLEHVDAETTAALVDFSFHLACGHTDEAYRSVRGVQSASVWESMSKMCVKTGRLDVAQKCLGQMSHARAASALRACTEPEEEARLAVVAIHLDMIEDAEHLLTKCGRFDLLNQLYQACGEWDKALEVAKARDRLHLKPTHFAYAQHLEAIEDVPGALNHFELSGTYRTESPRLLCSLGMTDELEAYVEQSDDQHLHRWYAQYLESKANLDGAAREYKKAGDWLSLCRVACFNKELDRAQRICEESQDQAACYHLARHLEAEGRIKDAIRLFEMAGRVSHALRLAQENHMDADLMSLALSSDPANMAQAARYYEQREPSKAVVLFQKAGCQKKALELCFSACLFDALRKIADDLSADSDPEILAKCAEFFMQHRQHEKAVHLLSLSQQFARAVDLCDEHDVHVTEDMAERMTPEKSSMTPEERSHILLNLAKLCKKQGSFQLACKKFTQAGDKLKAMKSLLKSGDTEKIIFFAGTARQADIYVLAGNYLQSLDWHNDPEIMKNIIQFYTKAKAHDKLAAFYDACAQVEIDEYRDYEKASGALREALKYLVKTAGSAADSDERVFALQNRIALVEKFAAIRGIGANPEAVVTVCEKMLGMTDIESSVRVGDVFAQLVEHYVDVEDLTSAYKTVERMRERGIILTPYLDRSLLTKVYDALNLAVPESESGAPDDHPEEIDESS